MYHMKTATVRDLRNNFAKVSRWIRAGEEVTITCRGDVMGRIVPMGKPEASRPRKRFDADAHSKWLKETYKGKVLKGNSALLMREGSKW